MISGYNRAAETLAALNVAQALLTALHRKGLFSDQEIDELLTSVSGSMAQSPLAQVKEAADIVETMKQEALGQKAA
ncbi:MAG: hypothetical protein MI920_39080 [Kiloniellales bacterium]|nr:hypothetical protein [Kiloniellales bacterium]